MKKVSILSVVFCLMMFVGVTNALAGYRLVEKVNSNWRIYEYSDVMDSTKTYYVETTGKHIDHEGKASRFEASRFSVVIEKGESDLVWVSDNDYPGNINKVVIRVDNNRAIVLSSFDKARMAIKQLKYGKGAFVRYRNWPDGRKEMYIDATGFTEAYDKAMALIK